MRRAASLLRGLPEEALLRTTREQREQETWTVETELLAQVVEEVSILTAKHQRKKPREVPRPRHMRKSGGPQRPEPQQQPGQSGDTAASRGVAVLKATQRKVVQNAS